MAYGTELMLVLEKADLIKYLDPALTAEEREEVLTYEDYEFSNNLDPALRYKIAEIYFKLVQTHIDPNAVWLDGPWERGVFLSEAFPGEKGEKKELSMFSIEGVSEEDGPTTFGISLISRYTPTWLDWKTTHGGSGDSLIIDTEMLQMVEFAREAVGAVVPEILTAPLVNVSVHY